MHVSASEIRDLDFANDASRHLRHFSRQLQNGFNAEVCGFCVFATCSLSCFQTKALHLADVSRVCVFVRCVVVVALRHISKQLQNGFNAEVCSF